MSSFHPRAYGPVLAPLVDVDRRRSLGPGTPDRTARDALAALTPETAFGGVSVADRDMAACVTSAVWLVHDFLDESHTISQGVDTTSGSFWHGIMHRREGDFSNAKYWFRRVGRHPVCDGLALRAAGLIETAAAGGDAGRVVAGGGWDPFAFVDLCAAAQRGHDDLADLCLNMQQSEWELLFDFCYRAAVGWNGGD